MNIGSPQRPTSGNLPLEMNITVLGRVSTHPERQSGVQFDVNGRILLSSFSCADGSFDPSGLLTDGGKLYGAFLVRWRVEGFQPVDWDDQIFDGVRTGFIRMTTYPMIGSTAASRHWDKDPPI